MASLSNIVHLGVKELRSLYRDPVLFVFIILGFTFMVYGAGKGLSQELRNAAIAVVDEDQSPLSRRVLDAFYEPYFQTPVPIRFADIDPGMDSGRYTFVLIFPPHFQRDVINNQRPEVQLNIDATQMTQASLGANYISNIIDSEIADFTHRNLAPAAPAIKLNLRYRFNPTLTSTWFGGVMELSNLVTLLSIILTGAALIREREHGTLEHLLVMPLTPLEIMLAKVWAMGLVVLVAAGLSLKITVQGILGMPVAGSIPLYLACMAVFLFSTTSLGILLGTLVRSMPQLGLLTILLIMPLQMLSGTMTPFESMPEAVQRIMQFAPTTHFVRIAQAILYRGAGLSVVWPNVLAMIAIGGVFFVTTLTLFRRSIGTTR